MARAAAQEGYIQIDDDVLKSCLRKFDPLAYHHVQQNLADPGQHLGLITLVSKEGVLRLDQVVHITAAAVKFTAMRTHTVVRFTLQGNVILPQNELHLPQLGRQGLAGYIQLLAEVIELEVFLAVQKAGQQEAEAILYCIGDGGGQRVPVFVVPCLVGVAVLHSEAVAVALARLNSCTVTFQFRAQLPDAGLHSTAAGATFDSQCLGCEIVVLRQKSEQAHEVAVKHGVLPVLFSLRQPGGRKWSVPRSWQPANLSVPGCTENRSPSGG